MAGDRIAPPFEGVLRGLRDERHVRRLADESLAVDRRAFEPDRRPDRLRRDGAAETSIDFEYDAGALPRLAATPEAKFGVCRLAVTDFERIRTRVHSHWRGVSLQPDGERRRRGLGNPYHGNIVFARPLWTDELGRRLVCEMLAIQSDLCSVPVSP